MKILFLPDNIASMQAITAQSLNEIPGINAVCLVRSRHKYQEANASVTFLREEGSKMNIFKWLFRRLQNIRTIKKMIKEADILHYVWGYAVKGGLDLKWAYKQNKIIFIEWIGTDIRNPDIAIKINKYYKAIFKEGYENKNLESSDYKCFIQKKFAAVKAIPFACPEMSLWINKELFPEVIPLYQRIDVKSFIPLYPEIKTHKLRIVHSPSAKITKGSNIISKVIAQIKLQYDFEFVLLHDVPRVTVLEEIKKADIFIDQIILGGYGMAAMEAMAFGKPVMAYIMPAVFEAGLPFECPIVNCNPDNLKEQLELLLENAHLRNEIGKAGRAFVEKYHDADKIAFQLMDIYTNKLKLKRK